MRNVKIYNMLDPYFVKRTGYGYAWGGGVAHGIDGIIAGKSHGTGDGEAWVSEGDGYGRGDGYGYGRGDGYGYHDGGGEDDENL